MLRLFLLIILLPGAVSAQALSVFTAVLPMRTLVQQVGGEHVRAESLVRTGFNPHTYEPTPQQIRALSGAALYLYSGLPFERAWLPRLRAANPQMQILDALDDDEVDHADAHEHAGHNHAHGHGHGVDPHTWTDPLLAIQMATRIRDALIHIAPQHQAAFNRNHAALVTRLKQLHSEIQAMLEPLQQRRFLVFHPAWGHFAERYGLTQVAIEHEGKQPGARTLAGLIEQARREHIRVILVQPQFDTRLARQVARAIDGRIVTVDPLSADYMENLRRVAQELKQALQS